MNVAIDTTKKKTEKERKKLEQYYFRNDEGVNLRGSADFSVARVYLFVKIGYCLRSRMFLVLDL